MSTKFTPTVKRAIKPVTITVTLQATRVNENGTFSGFVVQKASGPNGTFKVSIPPQGGGSIYLKVDSLEGLTVLDAEAAAVSQKVKLF
jgi:hypothetical protein